MIKNVLSSVVNNTAAISHKRILSTWSVASDTKGLDFTQPLVAGGIGLCKSRGGLYLYLFIFWLHCSACGILVPWPGCPLQWKHGVLTTGPVGKPSVVLLKVFCSPHFVCFQKYLFWLMPSILYINSVFLFCFFSIGKCFFTYDNSKVSRANQVALHSSILGKFMYITHKILVICGQFLMSTIDIKGASLCRWNGEASDVWPPHWWTGLSGQLSFDFLLLPRKSGTFWVPLGLQIHGALLSLSYRNHLKPPLNSS